MGGVFTFGKKSHPLCVLPVISYTLGVQERYKKICIPPNPNSLLPLSSTVCLKQDFLLKLNEEHIDDVRLTLCITALICIEQVLTPKLKQEH